MDLYTAYLVLCMVSPLGAEFCAPAAVPKVFTEPWRCQAYLKKEVEELSIRKLDSFKPHLPSMKEGKLKLRWRCSMPTHDKWLGRDLP